MIILPFLSNSDGITVLRFDLLKKYNCSTLQIYTNLFNIDMSI